MCPTCDEYDVEVIIHGPAQLRRIVEKLKAAVRNQRLLADDERSGHDMIAQVPFLDLDLRETMPDALSYYMRCSTCDRSFMLCCETYHGSGGKWCRV
jgi:hypothetical protein